VQVQNSRRHKRVFADGSLGRRAGQPALFPTLEVDVDIGAEEVYEKHQLLAVARVAPLGVRTTAVW
jgi:hypothetical protein